MPVVRFERENKALNVLPGTNLRQVALKAGVELYAPLQRVVHIRAHVGDFHIPCASDVVEIEGKGMNGRTEEEELLVAGRLLPKYKVQPNHRLACLVNVTGDISVRTMPLREVDKANTNLHAKFYAFTTVFSLFILGLLLVLGLDIAGKF
jgi:hypothetical protein